MGHRASRQRSRKPESDESENDPGKAATSLSTNGRKSTGCRPGNIDWTPDTSRSVESGAPVQREAGAQYETGQREDDSPDRGYVDYNSEPDRQGLSDRYGFDVRRSQLRKLQRLETEFGTDQVRRWADEGMTVETMGKPRDMQVFRERQADRSDAVPSDVERQNEASLQRNTATNRTIQPTLRVSEPDDPAEREASRVAEEVMEASDERHKMATAERSEHPSGGRNGTSVSRPSTTPIEDRTPRIDESPRSCGPTSEQQAGEDVERALGSSSGGKPLPPATRSFFEPRFGRNFGDVRVHTGEEAADLNRQLDAKAFTDGSDVYFGEGQYRPETPAGKQLLAHELTHAIQQTGSGRTVDRSHATSIQLQRDNGTAATQGEFINWSSLVLEDLFQMWVENEYQHGNTPPEAPPKEKIQHQVRRRLNWKIENDDNWRETFNWFLENEPNVNHANGYWLREAIRYRLREEGPGMAVSGDCVEDVEYAKLSQAVYGNDPPPEGWIPDEDVRNERTGFHAASYINETCKEKVIAFEGTMMSLAAWANTLADWANNIAQVVFARSAQYSQAMALAQKAQQNVSSETQLKFVGHSLGGGLASAASIVTGAPAVTFNAAGVRRATVVKYLLRSGSWGDIPKAFKNPNVKAYYIDDEILSYLQDNTPAPAAVGERIPLEPASKGKSRRELHSMDEVIKAMEKRKDSAGKKNGNVEGELPEGKAPPSPEFDSGVRVKTTSGLRIRDGPSLDTSTQATAPAGKGGVIVDGPEMEDAYWWWKIEYDAGYTGWSAQTGLTKSSVDEQQGETMEDHDEKSSSEEESDEESTDLKDLELVDVEEPDLVFNQYTTEDKVIEYLWGDRDSKPKQANVHPEESIINDPKITPVSKRWTVAPPRYRYDESIRPSVREEINRLKKPETLKEVRKKTKPDWIPQGVWEDYLNRDGGVVRYEGKSPRGTDIILTKAGKDPGRISGYAERITDEEKLHQNHPDGDVSIMRKANEEYNKFMWDTVNQGYSAREARIRYQVMVASKFWKAIPDPFCELIWAVREREGHEKWIECD